MKPNRNTLIIILVCLLSWGINLLNGGYFWDDWVYYDISSADMKTELFAPGYVTFYYYFNALFSISSSPLFLRFTLFLLILVSVICHYKALEKSRLADNSTLLITSLLFATLPFMHASAAFITANYYTALCVFSIGTFLFVSNWEKPVLWKRITYLILFFLSFFINSFITFLVYPLLLVFLGSKECSIKSASRLLLNNADLFITTFIFLVFKSLVLKPSGKFEGYNEVTFGKILSAPGQVIRNTIEVMTGFFDLFTIGNFNFLYLALLALVLYSLVRKRKEETESKETYIIAKTWIWSGALLFFIGIFPYSMVYKTPYFYDMESRHQLLLPFGTAFIISGVLTGIRKKFQWSQQSSLIIGSVMIAAFISINQSKYTAYLLDWFRQESIIENLKESGEVKNHKTFIVQDNTAGYNVNGRYIRPYEYRGYMHAAFGDETRDVLEKDEPLEEIIANKKSMIYNIKDYRPDTATHILTFDQAAPISNVRYLVYWRYGNKAMYKSQIKQYTTVTVTPKQGS